MSIRRGDAALSAPHEPVWMILGGESAQGTAYGTVSNVGSGTAVAVRLRVSCDHGLGPVVAQAAEVAPEGELQFAVDTTVVDVATSRLIVDWRGPGGRRMSFAAPLSRAEDCAAGRPQAS